MKKILAVILVFMMVFSSLAFAEEKKLTSSDYYNSYETVMGLINTMAVTDKTEIQLFRGAIVKLAETDPDLYYQVMDKMVKQIDENCAFYTEDEYLELYNQLVGETGGLGITGMVVDGYFEVASVFEDGSGFEAGVEVGDRLIECDGHDLTGKNAETAVNYVRGEIGSVAKIKILKKSGKVVEKEITRKQINIEYHYSEILDDNIGYIQISSFADTVGEEFLSVLDNYKVKGIKNVIIDLRYNTGGYMNSALEIASDLLEKGDTIISVRSKNGESHSYKAEGGDGYKFNFVILVNEYTASAAEILTVALTENGKAVSVGTKTFGKATVQQLFQVATGGYLRITVQQYLSPLGNFIHKEGITPAHEVENEIKTYTLEEIDQPSYTTKPKLGDKSEDVEKIEGMLDLLGYDVGEPDEYFGEDTERAVRMFQSRMGLFVYGVCDLTTQANMRDVILETKFEQDTQLEYAKKLFE